MFVAEPIRTDLSEDSKYDAKQADDHPSVRLLCKVGLNFSLTALDLARS